MKSRYPASPALRPYSVEVCAYRLPGNARLVIRSLCERSIPCRMSLEGGFYRVRAGRFAAREEAEDYRILFLSLGYPGAKVVYESKERREKV